MDDKLNCGLDASQGGMQLLQEMGDKLGSSVRNDGLEHTMQTHDASNIQLNVILNPVVGVHQNKMSRFGEPINDHPYGVKFVGRERQTHDEIHVDFFPFPSSKIQRLQQFGRPHMIILDPSTHVRFCNIASSLTLHSSPPELCFQIMIHLRATRVDGIFRSMSLIENLLAQLMVLWKNQAVFEP
jgi:hypothetical protein